jgi:oligopeptide/dipeptide ABC transporter ATP-binding protein
VNDLLEAKSLKKHFPIKAGILKGTKNYVKAIDDVSFSIGAGEIFGLVGESGCGKSTLAKVVLRLLEPTGGEIYFQKRNICFLSADEMRRTRRDMQIIFQDPQASLNPRMTIQEIIQRPMKVFDLPESTIREETVALVEKVGLVEDHLNSYPHELSGGQQQRVGIARALSLHPKLLVLDEPTSSLDVSIQSQIINLLMQLQHEFRLTYLFISHNLSVVRFMSQRIAVMYLGRIAELADKKELFEHTAHPYAQALFSAIPRLGRDTSRERIILQGATGVGVDLPPGCRFRPRCRYSGKECEDEPELREIGPQHYVACHRV